MDFQEEVLLILIAKSSAYEGADDDVDAFNDAGCRHRNSNTLQAIANTLGNSIKVTSGDSNFVPRGGATHSLINEAIDFHVDGLSDEAAFGLLRLRRRDIFGTDTGNSFRYQIIRHGSHTRAQGPHIHLGIVPMNNTHAGRGFLEEVLREGQGYTPVEFP